MRHGSIKVAGGHGDGELYCCLVSAEGKDVLIRQMWDRRASSSINTDQSEKLHGQTGNATHPVPYSLFYSFPNTVLICWNSGCLPFMVILPLESVYSTAFSSRVFVLIYTFPICITLIEFPKHDKAPRREAIWNLLSILGKQRVVFYFAYFAGFLGSCFTVLQSSGEGRECL